MKEEVGIIGEKAAAVCDVPDDTSDALAFATCENRVLTTLSLNKPRSERLATVLKVLATDLGFAPSSLHLFDERYGKFVLSSTFQLPQKLHRDLTENEGVIGMVAAHRSFALLGPKECAQVGFVEKTHAEDEPLCAYIIPLVHQDDFLGLLSLGSKQPSSEMREKFAKRLGKHISLAIYNAQQQKHLENLALQNNELKRANRLKSEFFATMSHELRAPLNAIIGFSELLKEQLVGPLSPQQVDYATEIFTNGERLLSLINDIVDLSKVEANTQDITVHEIDVRRLCARAVCIVKEIAARKRIVLSVDNSSAPQSLRGDERKLKQILNTLLSNAIKFTDDQGTVSLTVHQLDAGGPKECIVFRVSDTGIGIHPEEQKRMFLPIPQPDGSLAQKYQGTGLGLQLCSRLVDLHGGQLQVESAPGKGSHFTVILPVHGIGENRSESQAECIQSVLEGIA